MRILCISDPAFQLLSSDCADVSTELIELFGLEIIWMEGRVHLMCVDEQSCVNYPVNPSHLIVILIKIKNWLSVSTICLHRYLISLCKLVNWK